MYSWWAEQGASMEAAGPQTTGPTSDRARDSEEQEETIQRLPTSAIDRQYSATPPDVPRRVYILGTGSVGKLVAHALRGIPNPPPITLLLHRYKLLEAWRRGKQQITVQDGEFTVPRSGYEVELTPEVRRQHGVELRDDVPDVYDIRDDTNLRSDEAAQLLKLQQEQEEKNSFSLEELRSHDNIKVSERKQYYSRPEISRALQFISDEPIHNLIVTTKAVATIAALTRITHRIDSSTTICFLQNGMGIVDDVNKELFPNPDVRPTYVQGIVSHGVNVPPEVGESDPFFAVHAGHGTIALGLVIPGDVPRNADGDAHKTEDLDTPSARYLVRTLTRTPVLCATAFTPTELLQQQLEKLAVNSVINPLTSLIDARNGAILNNQFFSRTMRLLLAETSFIIRNLPELRNIPNVNARFSGSRLEHLVIKQAFKTKDNVSSMLADVRAGKRPEIEYINGYIVKRGEEIGIKAVVNYSILNLVLGKSKVAGQELEMQVPLLDNLNPG
ncbi:2-dehydropantoate 2-reductase [Teratosphaeria destructans]|uniref:2-dehydropantoate 2-reductase n=1 Tax=Teratosphaeria destructans TaxID=418781 RepID=A0A9W7W060_9PEZI|nr:2-dehydropantoate 2-reductase [Teratosphaeria destructans]